MNPALFLALPALALLAGGVVASRRPPGPRTRATIQHFAAGVVFAAAAGEVLPSIIKRRQPWEVVLGFSVGVGVMLLVKTVTERLSSRGQRSPFGMLVAFGIDVLVDGVLVGLGFAAGTQAGILLSIALSTELAFLGVTAAASMCGRGESRMAAILATAVLGAVFLAGAVPAALLSRFLSAASLDVFLAFGLVALLYLVTEELLVEAHEVKETPYITTMFFAGFLAFVLLEMNL